MPRAVMPPLLFATPDFTSFFFVAMPFSPLRCRAAAICCLCHYFVIFTCRRRRQAMPPLRLIIAATPMRLAAAAAAAMIRHADAMLHDVIVRRCRHAAMLQDMISRAAGYFPCCYVYTLRHSLLRCC